MDISQKIGGFYPQNGWLFFMGKPYEQMDDLGGKNPLFLVQHPPKKNIIVHLKMDP